MRFSISAQEKNNWIKKTADLVSFRFSFRPGKRFF